MNTYALDLSAQGEGLATLSPTFKQILKALGYMALYGKNVNVIPTYIGRADLNGHQINGSTPVSATGDFASMHCPVMVFDLDFSLSNLKNFWNQPITSPSETNTTVGLELVYDTSCQSVREFVDKPYPVKGYTAIVLNDGTTDPTKDLDGFTTFNIFNGLAVKQVYVGKLNSSKTDFYTPLGDNTAIIVDTNNL